MKHAPKSLVVVSFFAFSGAFLVPSVHAGPMGRSAKMAARLKKYPTSAWLAHYLPDDRYKIAGGVWKYVSTDLDTYYHRPNSPLMLRQPAGRVIGFSSTTEAEEAGYQPSPGLDDFGAMDSGMGATPARSTPGKRVVLADGVSSLALPAGWRKSAGKVQRASNVNSTTERFFGPKGARFEISTLTVNAAAPVANIDMKQFITVDFFNQLKLNRRGTAGSIDQVSQRSGAVNSQFSGQNMVSALNQLENYQVSRINLSGMEGVGTTIKRPMTGQPNRTYSFGRGRKVWSINDFSPRRQSLSPILKTLRLR